MPLPARGSLLLEGHRHVRIGGQPHDSVLDIGYQPERDEMVMSLMAALDPLDLGPGILLGQLDPVALDTVDRPDMDAVRADDFGMFLNLACIDHIVSPALMTRAQRTRAELVA